MKGFGVKLTLFLVFFIVEVRIDARAISWPNGCVLEDLACSVGNDSMQWRTSSVESIEAHLGPDAIISRRGADRLHLVSGQAIIVNRGGQTLEVSFASGAVRLEPHHEVFLEVLPGKVEVQAQVTKVKVLVDDSGFDLPPGMMIERLLNQFPARWSVPRAFAFEEMLGTRSAAGLVTGQHSATELAKLWKRATEVASETSRHLVERKLASERERDQRLKAQRAQREAESRRLRALFLEKNFLDQ